MDTQSIIIAVMLPTVLAAVAGLPFWIKRRTVLGNLVGSGLIAGAMIVLIWQGYGDFVGEQEACTTAGTCGLLSVEGIFTRFLGFVVIGWMDVLLILILGGVVEQRVKRRSPRREWW